MDVRNGFFKTFDGTRLFYWMEGNGPPLLFCYGLVCSKLHWSYQIEYFKKNYTIIWFDYRGHHLSDTPENVESLNIENMARDIECLLDELDIPSVFIMGHSMGVNLVLEFYKRCADRVKGMVLCSGTARAPLETLLRSNLFQTLMPLLDKAYQRFPKISNFIWRTQGQWKLTSALVGYLGFNPNLSKSSDIELYVKMVTELDMKITLQLLRSYENYDATPWLPKVNVPVLIIAGENDHVIPREAQELLHQLIPKSQFEVIRNGSHCTQMDLPDLINIMIERFLNERVPDYAQSPQVRQLRSSVSTKSAKLKSRHGEAS